MINNHQVVTCEEMKEIERRAASSGLSYYQMMENAGTGAAEVIKSEPISGKRVLVFCGNGNNGGDGFVVARKLFEAGADVKLILVHGEPKTEDAITNWKICRDMLAIPEIMVKDLIHASADIIVDAIYGTGFKGNINDEVKEITHFINDSGAKIYALDIPSGLSGDGYYLDEYSIKSDYTLVFHRLKPIHMNANAVVYCGKCKLIDIGIRL